MTASPKSDPQREAVYRMEDRFMSSWSSLVLPPDYLSEIARRVCRKWKVPQPRLRAGQKVRIPGGHAATYSSGGIITLGSRGMNPAVLAHELAHHIDHVLYHDMQEPGYEAHGPTWTWIEMTLLDELFIMPASAFRALAKEYRVKIARKRPKTRHEKKR